MLTSFYDRSRNVIQFDALRIHLASPDKISSWSYGEVKKPETINYRTFKPEKDGLFCARIFGPTKDWECSCGKYKRMKHRGVVCDKCGVEVIQSKVRRERMGHIELAAPVAHIWFLKGLPSRIGNLLDVTLNHLERVLYFEAYIVLDPGETAPVKERDVLTETEARELLAEHPDLNVGMGAEAIRELLNGLDLKEMSRTLATQIREATSMTTKNKLIKQQKVVEAFLKSNNRPEWMILTTVPVLPPDLRPLVPLDGGRFATSDLNDLYRRVINRNNRLKRLLELKAPNVIIRNEKRMLQESVDALFDNGRRGRAIRGANKRPLKSLSDMLKGKQGRFRQNLLGKRVDYSGRTVIVVGPELKIHQCGLPKKMALELFKPFIFSQLEKKGFCTTIKSAKRMVEMEEEVVWDVLEEVIKEHPVMLNRAPTLHRLGIQAFDPVLVEGKAIRLHPLACTAFNADFDGDQMAVHLPLSLEAQVEVRALMMSVNNILSPASGQPIMVPSQDMVLGCYWLTKDRAGSLGEGRIYYGPEEVVIALDQNELDTHARITVRIHGERFETTAGRVVLSRILPEGIAFDLVNKEMGKKNVSKLIDTVFRDAGPRATVRLLDDIKDVGYKYATRSGISISIDDMHIPENKGALIDEAKAEVKEIEVQYGQGLITKGERYNKVVDVWSHATDLLATTMMDDLRKNEEEVKEGKLPGEDFNSIYMMADSGARGSAAQIKQLGGMRGLMAKPTGEIIETPITSNFREGLTMLQYFISTHGARKGLADTALKTANAGYLTRRLVDVAQDIIITSEDCGTLDGITVTALVEGGEIVGSLEERILGRCACEDIHDPINDEVLVAAGDEIDENRTAAIVDAGIDEVRIRSMLTCELRKGVCVKCYGRDLSSGGVVQIGEAVGVIAAQSIGEPGTQLTMRTFHIGGTASKVAEESVLNAKNPGTVRFIDMKTVRDPQGQLVVLNRKAKIAIDEGGREKEKYAVVYGAKLFVEEGQEVKSGEKLVEWDPFSNAILTEVEGVVATGDITEGVTMRDEVDEVTGISRRVITDFSDTSLRPRISIKDDSNHTIALPDGRGNARYLLPSGANVLVEKGQKVYPGDVLAKISRETTKTKDITGGLPRVAELFEARRPKECAVISEIAGSVEFAGFAKGMRKLLVRNELGDEKEYLIPRGKHINVHEGDWVEAGEPLMDGAANPHDILAILGPKELQKYIVNEVQEVYKLQGVTINDKHIEVVVRQMMRKVQIIDPGDTGLLPDALIDRMVFADANQKVLADDGTPATAKPVLLGITKAALSTDSFISAASFQETTRVLTEAAVSGKIDELAGLKENVIVGRRIPAGTGQQEYRRSYVPVDVEAAKEEAGKIADAQAAAIGAAAESGALRASRPTAAPAAAPVQIPGQADQATGS